MEIERKFLVKQLPADLEAWPVRRIEQAYLCTRPVLRVRRSGERYFFTYKGEGLLAREEHEFPLEEEAYRHLLAKADGAVISKERYCIPLGPYTIELDVFAPPSPPWSWPRWSSPARRRPPRSSPPPGSVRRSPAARNSPTPRSAAWAAPLPIPDITNILCILTCFLSLLTELDDWSKL